MATKKLAVVEPIQAFGFAVISFGVKCEGALVRLRRAGKVLKFFLQAGQMDDCETFDFGIGRLLSLGDCKFILGSRRGILVESRLVVSKMHGRESDLIAEHRRIAGMRGLK